MVSLKGAFLLIITLQILLPNTSHTGGFFNLNEKEQTQETLPSTDMVLSLLEHTDQGLRLTAAVAQLKSYNIQYVPLTGSQLRINSAEQRRPHTD